MHLSQHKNTQLYNPETYITSRESAMALQ